MGHSPKELLASKPDITTFRENPDIAFFSEDVQPDNDGVAQAEDDAVNVVSDEALFQWQHLSESLADDRDTNRTHPERCAVDTLEKIQEARPLLWTLKDLLVDDPRDTKFTDLTTHRIPTYEKAVPKISNQREHTYWESATGW